jgi:site-specific recombinase XerD
MDCTALTVVEQPALPAELTATLKLAADFAKASKAKATQYAYRSDFRIFESWCRPRGLSALPATAESLCAFLADQAALGKRASTLGRRLAAIRYFHRAAGYDTPTGDEKVKAVLSGIRRTIGAAPVRKAPVMPELAIAMTSDSGSLRALRNRAIVLLGFASAMRRSELVALDVADIEWRDTGILITIRESKTDKFKQGQQVGVVKGSVACPVAALRAWINAAGVSDGPIFRRIINKRSQRVTDRRLAARNVAAIVKAGVARLGLNAADYGGHSLRRGFVSAAVRKGANVAKIAEQTRHASLDMILVYQKSAELLSADNAGAGLL